jgi:hypothetical protein
VVGAAAGRVRLPGGESVRTMTILELSTDRGEVALCCFTGMLTMYQAAQACSLLRGIAGNAMGIRGHNMDVDAMSASQVEHFEWFASRVAALDGGEVFGDEELICLTGAQAAEGLRRLGELARLSKEPAVLPS